MTFKSVLRNFKFLSVFVGSALSIVAQGQSLTIPSDNSLIATSALTSDSGSPKLKIAIDSFLMGRSVEDAYYKTAGSLLDINPRFDIIYNSWLSFDLLADGVFITGNTQSFYTQEGNSVNTIFLDEAAANIKPWSFLQLSGGALYTTINPIQSIMSPNSFVGGSGKLDLDFSGINTKVSFIGVGAVPSSGTITRELVDDAPNAYFMTQTLQTETVIKPISTTFKFAATHFEFGNLSANVAADSELIGNSPESFEGIGPNTRYIIGFEGMETAATIQTDWFKHLSTEFTASAILNDEAPSDRNSGTELLSKVTWKLQRINIIPSFLIFDMGADVTPATYTLLPYRYQNRDGYTAQLMVELKKEKVSFFGSYSKGDVIEPNPYMADRESYTIGLEAKYDLL